jgi:hypothetical protein
MVYVSFSQNQVKVPKSQSQGRVIVMGGLASKCERRLRNVDDRAIASPPALKEGQKKSGSPPTPAHHLLC